MPQRDLHHQAVRNALTKDGWTIILARYEPERRLYLAVPSTAFEAILADDVGRAVREDTGMPIIVFDARKEIVKKWLP